MENKITCYEFPYFGAKYPDATCINGYLWDLDSSEEVDGQTYLTQGGDVPCPFCKEDAYIEYREDNIVTKERLKTHISYLKSKYGKPIGDPHSHGAIATEP